jgi:hypothetical protein
MCEKSPCVRFFSFWFSKKGLFISSKLFLYWSYKERKFNIDLFNDVSVCHLVHSISYWQKNINFFY